MRSPVAGSWKSETSTAGYTGSSYYAWRGPDLFHSPGSGVLTYRVRITTPGKYNLRIRNMHTHADSTLENDCFTRLDGGPWVKTFSSIAGSWTWHTRHEFSSTNKVDASYQLSAGDHVFEISGRSVNFMIDRIHLYQDGVAGALDASRPESPTTTASTDAGTPTTDAGTTTPDVDACRGDARNGPANGPLRSWRARDWDLDVGVRLP